MRLQPNQNFDISGVAMGSLFLSLITIFLISKFPWLIGNYPVKNMGFVFMGWVLILSVLTMFKVKRTGKVKFK